MKRKLIALTLVISVSVLWLGTEVLFPTAHLAAQPVIEPLVSLPPDEAAIQRWRQEAQQFDVTIKEIEGILRLDLNTKEGIDQADKILDKNESKLPFATAKIASGSLKFPAFRKAVEEEARKHGGNEKFAEAFKRDPSVAKGIPGLQEVAKQMEAEIQPAIEVLKRVEAAFAKAAKKQNAKATPTQFDSLAGNYFLAKAAYTSTVCASEPKEMSFPAPANFCRSVGITVSKTICNIIDGVILTFIGLVAGHLDCLNSCIDRAVSRRKTCMRRASQLPWPLYGPAYSICDEQLAEGVTACLLRCD